MPETPASPSLATAYFLHSVAPDAAFQNVQLSLNLGESYPVEDLREAWQKVVASHGVLRSSVARTATGETLRRENEAAAVSWASLNWTEVPAGEIPGRWQALLEEDARQSFDPAAAPLTRFQAIELPGGHRHLLLTYPKLLLDEDSLFHIVCAWLEALQGVAPQAGLEVPPPPAATPATAEWWSRFFSGNPEPMNFQVYPKARLLEQPSRRQEHGLFMDRETSRELKALCARLDLPPRDVFLAVWSLVLSRLISRDSALLLACCAAESAGENFLPCRILINHAAPVDAWLKEISRAESERAKHSAISLERVLLLAEPSRKPRDFPAVFRWSPPPLNDRIHDVFARWINLDALIISSSPFPLGLQVRDGNRFFLQVESDPAICPAAEAETLLRRITVVIESILENPSQNVGALSILTEAELRSLDTGAPTDDSGSPEPLPVGKAFAEIASRQPDALAVTDLNDAALSFSELDSHARSLASWLGHENLADGWNIAVCLTPTPWLPVAVLGILRAGDTCVPLDPNSAPGWLSAKVEDADIEMIVCDSRTAPFFEGLSRKLLILDQQWESVAASTGGGAETAQKVAFLLAGTEFDPPPELRALSPAFLADACRQSLDLWRFGPGDRLPLLAAPGTGAFVETLICSLISGATLVLPYEDDPLAVIETGSPTHLRISAAQWHDIAARLQRTSAPLPGSLRTVCVETTGVSPGLQNSWRTLNASGATGIFFHSPAGLSGAGLRTSQSGSDTGLPAGDSVIGFSTRGLSASLLDPAGQPLPPHYPGRLEISFPQHEAGPFFLPAWRDRAGAFHYVPPALAIAAAPPPQPGVASAKPPVLDSPGPASPAPPARDWEPLVLLHKTPDAPVLFLVHDFEGQPDKYRTLAGLLRDDWTLYGTTARGLLNSSACHQTVEAEAAALVETICLLDPEGPYHLFGYGYGSVLALEMARQLRVARRSVPYLALAGARPPESNAPDDWKRTFSRVFSLGAKPMPLLSSAATPVASAHLTALHNYRAHPLDGSAGVILGTDMGREVEAAWRECAPEALVETLTCPTAQMLTDPPVKRLVAILRDWMVPVGEEP